MRFDVLSLFPELFAPHLTHGVTRRAFEPGGPVQVKLWPLRDHGQGPYRRVDDRPFGGGPGMVMLAQPLSEALAAVRADAAEEPSGAQLQTQPQSQPACKRPVIHFSPTGRAMDQALIQSLAQGPGAILLCGRYEGIDQRFLDREVDMEVSLGDFVLSGGEIPALALIDAVARLCPGVLHDAASHEQDSFSQGLLDCPHYSRPERWTCGQDTLDVPEVLLSGNHARIARWRREQSLQITAARRPELIAQARAQGLLSAADERFLAGCKSRDKAL